MRIKEISKKIVAYACATALVVGSFAGYSYSNAKAAGLPDIILDGDEGTHASSLIGTFPGTDGEYVYEGWVNTKADRETAPDYKYLIFTYSGDIEFVRFEFVRFKDLNGDLTSENNMEKEVVWFNPNQDLHFVTADGSDIPYDTVSEDRKAMVIDLEKTVDSEGPVWEWFCDGFHIHNGAGSKSADGFREVGSFRIYSARLATASELTEKENKILAGEDVTEDSTEVVTQPATEAATEVVTQPATEAVTQKATEAVTQKATEKTTKAPVLKKAKVSKVYPKKKASKKLKVQIKKFSGAKLYRVQVAKKRSFTKKTILFDKYSKKATKTFKSKKFKNAKKLYVRVMAYKTSGKKKVAISKWSKAKKAIIKK